MKENTSLKRRRLTLFAALLFAVLLLSVLGWRLLSPKASSWTVNDKNYSLTVESADLDDDHTYLLLTVKALSEEGWEQITSPHFGYGLGFFSLRVPGLEPREGYVFDQNSPGIGTISANQLSQTEDSRTILLESQLTVEADKLQVRLNLMEEGLSLEVPLAPLPSVTVEIGASGLGAPNSNKGELSSFRLQSVSLTPVGCTLNANLDSDTKPRIFFRIADGSVCTSAQMCSTFRQDFGSSWHWRCRFRERQELNAISSVIVFDTEYPLDGSEPFPIDHDPALDPVTVPRGAPLLELENEDDYYSELFPVHLRSLMEALDGTYEEDLAAGQVTCTYRDVTVTFDPTTQEIIRDGAPHSTQSLFHEHKESLPFAWQAVQDGQLVVGFSVLKSVWQLEGFIPGSPHAGQVSDFGDWYVIP